MNDKYIEDEVTRVKNIFLSNMSHELRTPLTSIIGFAQLLHAEAFGALPPETKQYLGEVLVTSKRLLHLIENVLELTQIDGGAYTLNYKLCRMDDIIKEVINNLNEEVDQHRIRVISHIDDETNYILTDAQAIQRIIYQFASNAIKFSSKESEIIINIISINTEQYRIEVIDNGIGISNENINKLFIPFQQLNQHGKKYPGAGVGLALARKLVDLLGGIVGVESVPGKGSKFYAIMPRKK